VLEQGRGAVHVEPYRATFGDGPRSAGSWSAAPSPGPTDAVVFGGRLKLGKRDDAEIQVEPLRAGTRAASARSQACRCYRAGSQWRRRWTARRPMSESSAGSACQLPCEAPTVSAMCAPRTPIGFGEPVVVSRAVWCSISASSSAPNRITIAEIQSHVMNPIAPPSEP
jgi:hypothetical protein